MDTIFILIKNLLKYRIRTVKNSGIKYDIVLPNFGLLEQIFIFS